MSGNKKKEYTYTQRKSSAGKHELYWSPPDKKRDRIIQEESANLFSPKKTPGLIQIKHFCQSV